MFYSATPLDRLDHLRSDAAAVDALWQMNTTLCVPVWRNNVLVAKAPDAPPAAVTIPAPQSLPAGVHRTLLGKSLLDKTLVGKTMAQDESRVNKPATTQQETAWFSIDYSALELDQIEGLPDNSEFVDLRIAGPQLASDEGAILAYARALCFWQSNSRFCSVCGHGSDLVNAGHVSRCSNKDCASDNFPRTDPAVIMLVVNNNANPPLCLLGRNAAWPAGVFSTLAGFVEPGETLEAAVAREVKEESNIDVTDVQYVASQPWPFPRSIMLGFRAQATHMDVKIDPAELEDAQWFSREQLLEFSVWGDDNVGLKLPRPDSIARFLIDSWISETEQ